MSQVLYRKYRPKNFAQIKGQDHIVEVLRNMIINSQIAHAYLFSGPRGTGKTSTARVFSKSLNCLKLDKGEPCNACDNCKAIDGNDYIDVVEIDAASNRGINEMRELKERSAFSPVVGKRKVYIIDEVHMLTKEAFNAILKTLEEPPKDTVFIMATTEVHKVLPTILSRVVRFDFRLGEEASIHNKLVSNLKSEGITFQESAIKKLIKLAKGSFRDAESLLQKVITGLEKDKGKKVQLTDKLVEESLGLASDRDIDILVSSLTERNDIGELNTILTQIFSAGISPSQLLNEVIENVLEKLTQDTHLSKGLLMRLLIKSQDLLMNLNLFPDPYLGVKAGFSSLINFDLEAVKPMPIMTSAKLASKSPSPKKSTPDISLAKSRDTKASQTVVLTSTEEIENVKSQNQKERGENKPLNLELAEIKTNVISLMRRDAVRIASFVELAQFDFAETVITLLLPYKFHVQLLAQIKNKQIIAEYVKKVTDNDYEVVIDVVGKSSGTAKSDEVNEVGNKGEYRDQGSSKIHNQPGSQPQENGSNNSNEKMVEEIFSGII